ncbi:MAG: hypothetical protein H6607_06570 [Flavobacteriales bacterium]|nr:hypothetical protein [Flavobacteriales bacterium]
MARKVGISLCILISVLLILWPKGRSVVDHDQLHKKQLSLTEKTNEFLLEVIKEAPEIVKKKSDLPWHWRVFEQQNGLLTNWTSNDWLPDSSLFHLSKPTLYQHNGGWDLVIPVTENTLCTRKLTRIELGQFEAQNRITPLQNQEFEIKTDTSEFALLKGQAFLHFYDSTLHETRKGYFILIAFGLLTIASLLAFRKWAWGSIATVVSAILLRIFVLKNAFELGLGNIPLFSPSIFASSDLMPSLGDLLLHIVVAFIVLLAIFHLRPKWQIATKWKFVSLVFAFLVSFFGADLIESLVASLIKNSSISFDITNLRTIDIFSVLVVSMVAAMFWLLFGLLSLVFNQKTQQSVARKKLVQSILAALILFLSFQIIDGKRDIDSLLVSSIFVLIVLLVFYWLGTLKKALLPIYKYFIYTLLFSIFFCITLLTNVEKRELEGIQLFASKLTSNKDLEAEYLFKKMETSLALRFLEPADFSDFNSNKEEFEKKLRKLYFSGYLDRYNMHILSFDSVGNNINSTTLYTQEYLDQIYNEGSFPTLSHHFYQVRSDRIFNGYLAKFELCDITGHHGNIFILLEPKFFQGFYQYPDLMHQKKERRVFSLDHYSYALFVNNRLLNQHGSYPYQLYFDSSNFASPKTIFDKSGFHHNVIKQENSVVVLSHPNYDLKSYISTFSFSFSFFLATLTVFGIVWFGGWFLIDLISGFRPGLKKNISESRKQMLEYFGLEQVYLSTRIRLSMVILVFVGILFSVYATVQFVKFNNQNKSKSELLIKIREVANKLQNEVSFSKKLENAESRQFLVNEAADVYKVDVSLFDSSGKLLASSIDEIYNSGVVAPLMHPEANRVLRQEKNSQLIHEERIRNQVITSAYLPLVNSSRKVIAYLNLPYYAQNEEYSSEISNYTLTLVNLYLLLMLLAVAMAYFVSQRISKPLQIIREKMSKTDLETNELIEWKQNDEIGRLVKQYNKMVLQLGDSAQKLSESEREGAWKEMARQVAHEIKNPLTPMKLNIQHLQRAWADKNERLEDTFKRVTNVLIEQIDSLSTLATEFSSFAQMPVNNFENCNLTQTLLNTIVLFERSENIEFRYKTDMPEAIVFADKEQIGRAFNNVIKNATQAIPEDRKGLISINLELKGGKVLVSIKDNGKGISPENRAKIFVPNFSTKNSGMGLGLAITRKMIEAANGRIWFETEVDKGTTFCLEWPLGEDKQD